MSVERTGSILSRLPHAPAPLIARGVEGAIREAWEGPRRVSCVWGASGAGRSTAVYAALVGHAPLYIARSQRSADSALMAAARALDIDDLQRGTPHEVAARVFEAAEASGAALVIDMPWQLEQCVLLLDLAASHASASRWLFILEHLPLAARRVPHTAVALPTDAERDALLARLVPEWDDAARAALRAAAAPGWSALMAALDEALTPVQALDPDALALAGALAVWGDAPHALWGDDALFASMIALEAAGVVGRRGATWLLTARGAQLARPPLVQPLAARLRAHPDPSARLAAFELDAAADHLPALSAALEASLPVWLARGYGEVVWRRLRERREPELERHRLRCAFATLDGAMLEEVQAPTDSDPQTALSWLVILVERGDPRGALEVFAAVRDALHPRLARLLGHHLALCSADFAAVIEGAPGGELWEEALVALALAWTQERGRAVEAATRVGAALRAAAPSEAHRFAWIALGRALHLCGELRAAQAALREVRACVGGADEPPVLAYFYSAASVEYLEVLLSSSLLEMEGVHERLERLAMRHAPAHGLGFHVQQLAAQLMAQRGDHDGCIARCERLLSSVTRGSEAWSVLEVTLRRSRAARDGWATAQPLEARGAPIVMSAAAMFNEERALRLGEAWGGGAAPGAWLVAARALLAGEPQRAAEGLSRALEEARGRGDARRGWELLRCLTLVKLAAGERDEALLAQVAHVAARAENATWSAHAALLRSSGDSWSLLSMAGVGELGRAARGVLGARLGDALEALIAQGWARSLPWRATPGAAAPTVWVSSDGRWAHSAAARVELATRGNGLALLARLASEPAPWSKEALLRELWGVEDYHPLRHENRLRLAVFKLRRELELLGVEVIETLEDGYALAPHAAVISAR